MSETVPVTLLPTVPQLQPVAACGGGRAPTLGASEDTESRQRERGAGGIQHGGHTASVGAEAGKWTSAWPRQEP